MRSIVPSRLSRLFVALVGILATVLSLFWTVGTRPAAAQGQVTPRIYMPIIVKNYVPPEMRLCRLGVGGSDIASYNVGPLRVGWYMDWNAETRPTRPGGIAYAQTVRLAQTGPSGSDAYQIKLPNPADIPAIVQANPGAMWIIGNEPDRRKYQDNLEPQVYAHAYHDLYYQIKGLDATAQIVAGNIVQPTPLRLQYLQDILTIYTARYSAQMPVDIWGLHTYPLNEQSCDQRCPGYQDCWGADIPPGNNACTGIPFKPTDSRDPAIFRQFVITFRQWMYDHGYQKSQLILPEWGVLMTSDWVSDADVNGYMTDTMNWLTTVTNPSMGYADDNYHLVQRAAWYSLNDTRFNGWLFDPNSKARTIFGDNFAAQAASIVPVVNLKPVSVSAASGASRILAQVVNNGNISTSRPFIVRFRYKPTGTTNVQTQDQTVGLLDGCASSVTAGVDVSPGTYDVDIDVDPTGQINENNSDNRLPTTTLTVK
jgi:hypothetical protein